MLLASEVGAATVVSNLGQTAHSVDMPVGVDNYPSAGATFVKSFATSFTVGANPRKAGDGWTLNSVTAKFAAQTGSPNASMFRASLFSDSSGDPGAELAQLSGSAPATAGDHTYACSGSGCALADGTTYWLVFAADTPSTNIDAFYGWRNTLSDNETQTPANNGWSIGNSHRSKRPQFSWGEDTTYTLGSGLFSVDATAVAPPQAPAKPTADAGDAQVTLSWTAPDAGSSAITGYEYTKKAGAADFEASWTAIPSSASLTSFTVTGLTNGTAYRFKLRAVSSVGKGAESPRTDAVKPAELCGRTAQVRDAIVAAVSGKSACGDITATDLAGITVLNIFTDLSQLLPCVQQNIQLVDSGRTVQPRLAHR